MNPKNISGLSGQQLLIDFQNIIISQVTATAAENAAKQSEDSVLEQLASASRGSYLNPANIDEAQGDYMVRASLDAHIKKVQAEQLKSLTESQVQSAVEKDKKDYLGKKLRAISTDKDFRPFDAVWFDARSGYRSAEYKRNSVEGKIVEINFEKNLIVLRPSKLSKLLNANLENFVVYVLRPETLAPAVELHLI